MPSKRYSEIQSQIKNVVVSQQDIPESTVAVPIPSVPVSISQSQFTPELIEIVKEKMKQDKLEEQKKKKRDYQREYMRKYKKDIPLTTEEKLKKKVKRSLGKIDPELLKPIVAELLGECVAKEPENSEK